MYPWSNKPESDTYGGDDDVGNMDIMKKVNWKDEF